MQAQMSGQAAKERAEAYRTALQELTLFRSRTSAALLQVSNACCFSKTPVLGHAYPPGSRQPREPRSCPDHSDELQV